MPYKQKRPQYVWKKGRQVARVTEEEKNDPYRKIHALRNKLSKRGKIKGYKFGERLKDLLELSYLSTLNPPIPPTEKELAMEAAKAKQAEMEAMEGRKVNKLLDEVMMRRLFEEETE